MMDFLRNSAGSFANRETKSRNYSAERIPFPESVDDASSSSGARAIFPGGKRTRNNQASRGTGQDRNDDAVQNDSEEDEEDIPRSSEDEATSSTSSSNSTSSSFDEAAHARKLSSTRDSTASTPSLLRTLSGRARQIAALTAGVRSHTHRERDMRAVLVICLRVGGKFELEEKYVRKVARLLKSSSPDTYGLDKMVLRKKLQLNRNFLHKLILSELVAGCARQGMCLFDALDPRAGNWIHLAKTKQYSILNPPALHIVKNKAFLGVMFYEPPDWRTISSREHRERARKRGEEEEEEDAGDSGGGGGQAANIGTNHFDPFHVRATLRLHRDLHLLPTSVFECTHSFQLELLHAALDQICFDTESKLALMLREAEGLVYGPGGGGAGGAASSPHGSSPDRSKGSTSSGLPAPPAAPTEQSLPFAEKFVTKKLEQAACLDAVPVLPFAQAIGFVKDVFALHEQWDDEGAPHISLREGLQPIRCDGNSHGATDRGSMGSSRTFDGEREKLSEAHERDVRRNYANGASADVLNSTSDRITIGGTSPPSLFGFLARGLTTTADEDGERDASILTSDEEGQASSNVGGRTRRRDHGGDVSTDDDEDLDDQPSASSPADFTKKFFQRAGTFVRSTMKRTSHMLLGNNRKPPSEMLAAEVELTTQQRSNSSSRATRAATRGRRTDEESDFNVLSEGNHSTAPPGRGRAGNNKDRGTAGSRRTNKGNTSSTRAAHLPRGRASFTGLSYSVDDAFDAPFVQGTSPAFLARVDAYFNSVEVVEHMSIMQGYLRALSTYPVVLGILVTIMMFLTTGLSGPQMDYTIGLRRTFGDFLFTEEEEEIEEQTADYADFGSSTPLGPSSSAAAGTSGSTSARMLQASQGEEEEVGVDDSDHGRHSGSSGSGVEHATIASSVGRKFSSRNEEKGASRSKDELFSTNTAEQMQMQREADPDFWRYTPDRYLLAYQKAKTQAQQREKNARRKMTKQVDEHQIDKRRRMTGLSADEGTRTTSQINDPPPRKRRQLLTQQPAQDPAEKAILMWSLEEQAYASYVAFLSLVLPIWATFYTVKQKRKVRFVDYNVELTRHRNLYCVRWSMHGDIVDHMSMSREKEFRSKKALEELVRVHHDNDVEQLRHHFQIFQQHTAASVHGKVILDSDTLKSTLLAEFYEQNTQTEFLKLRLEHVAEQLILVPQGGGQTINGNINKTIMTRMDETTEGGREDSTIARTSSSSPSVDVLFNSNKNVAHLPRKPIDFDYGHETSRFMEVSLRLTERNLEAQGGISASRYAAVFIVLALMLVVSASFLQRMLQLFLDFEHLAFTDEKVQAAIGTSIIRFQVFVNIPSLVYILGFQVLLRPIFCVIGKLLTKLEGHILRDQYNVSLALKEAVLDAAGNLALPLYLLIAVNEQQRAVSYCILHILLRALFMNPCLLILVPYLWTLYKARRTTLSLPSFFFTVRKHQVVDYDPQLEFSRQADRRVVKERPYEIATTKESLAKRSASAPSGGDSYLSLRDRVLHNYYLSHELQGPKLNLYTEYLEILVNLCFLTFLFPVVPLIAPLAWIHLWVMCRTVSWRVSHGCRRVYRNLVEDDATNFVGSFLLLTTGSSLLFIAFNWAHLYTRLNVGGIFSNYVLMLAMLCMAFFLYIHVMIPAEPEELEVRRDLDRAKRDIELYRAKTKQEIGDLRKVLAHRRNQQNSARMQSELFRHDFRTSNTAEELHLQRNADAAAERNDFQHHLDDDHSPMPAKMRFGGTVNPENRRRPTTEMDELDEERETVMPRFQQTAMLGRATGAVTTAASSRSLLERTGTISKPLGGGGTSPAGPGGREEEDHLRGVEDDREEVLQLASSGQRAAFSKQVSFSTGLAPAPPVTVRSSAFKKTGGGIVGRSKNYTRPQEGEQAHNMLLSRGTKQSAEDVVEQADAKNEDHRKSKKEKKEKRVKSASRNEESRERLLMSRGTEGEVDIEMTQMLTRGSGGGPAGPA
ncbi:unnamed protein product [Amoebophrya sp. A120]|nr:unnamed protein product [Amoebophrya sp. A120]|eukprot:GSA120T00010929001.1